MLYTNETLITVTCEQCGHRWQMTYGDLQRQCVVYKGPATAAPTHCPGEEYHLICPNPLHNELMTFCLPAQE